MRDPQLESLPFPPADLEKILACIDQQAPVVCPICEAPLTAGPRLDATVEFSWVMHCGHCRRGVTISDLAPPVAH